MLYSDVEEKATKMAKKWENCTKAAITKQLYTKVQTG
jgi:hypothetical protein